TKPSSQSEEVTQAAAGAHRPEKHSSPGGHCDVVPVPKPQYSLHSLSAAKHMFAAADSTQHTGSGFGPPQADAPPGAHSPMVDATPGSHRASKTSGTTARQAVSPPPTTESISLARQSL